MRLKEIGRHLLDNSQVHKLRVEKQGKKYVVVVDKISSSGNFMFKMSHLHEKMVQ